MIENTSLPAGTAQNAVYRLSTWDISSVPWFYTAPLFIFALCSLSVLCSDKVSTDIKVPVGLLYQRYTPRWLSNAQFGVDAIGTIEKGYRKFKESAYKLIRSDVNMVVLPHSVMPELASLPNEIASGIRALERDLLGKWTAIHMIIESRLHHRMVQRKLTPNLSLVTPGIEDEVSSALSDIFPNSEEWTPVKPYYALLEVTARVVSRVLLGLPVCRNAEWLESATQFTENIFESIVIMRYFPPWLYTPLGFLLPSVWRTQGYVRKVHNLLGPLFAKRLEDLDNGTYKPAPGTQPDVFSWLAELSEGRDRDPTKLAHYELLLAQASIHTTLVREVNVLYDIIVEPRYLSMLREEIAHTQQTGWSKRSYHELHKLDSILKESQRVHPPTTIGLRRIMQQPYTLANGMHLPKDSYVCLPIYSIENDAANTENPEQFDGLRYYNKRLKNAGEPISQKHQFSSTDPTALGFGFGKTACPGRFFAGLVLKVLFVKLLTEYDFQFMPGVKERPKNLFAHEFLFPQRDYEILVRRRVGAKAPF
ncbi:putative cytochrome P450 [Lophiostoma macrostomum CBS 122681]|uniref:Putative cytochrome P450 n=1 Tax=Lophiostoma macrostomum CBS 122681 TaxID=1314788 RepID=A0A6A6SS57_9PLEO|nr:putative cytochrome P450 [Lophiostoma macrostomum CBS 122681]